MIMRKKFVYFVLIPVLIILVVLYLFLDRWVEAGLEYAGEQVNGAKVEIDHLAITLSPLGLRWDRLQVADKQDPWKNLFETGRVAFALNAGQLLRGKYIVETMEVNNLILGTKRTTDGSLPAKPEAPSATGGPSFEEMAKASLSKTIEQSYPIDLDMLKHGVNADSLVKALDIQSLKRIDSLKAQTVAASKQWDATLQDVEAGKKRLTDVGESLKSINPSQIKGVDQIVAAISTVDNAYKTVNDVKSQFADRKTSIENDVSRLSSSVSTLDQVATDDFHHLLSMAHLPDLNAAGIARTLVGKSMYDRALAYLHYVDVARSMIKKHSPPQKDPDPPRMKGQNITFPAERAYPKYWIQKMLVSGGTDSATQSDFIRARGEVLNITDDQSVTRKPTTASLEGSEAGKRAMSLSALFDRTKDIPYDEYTATLSGVPISEFQLGNSNFLPTKVSDARLTSSVHVAVPGNQFDLRANLTFANLHLVFPPSTGNKIESIVRDVLNDVKSFTVQLRMWTSGGSVDFALATDLDDQISARVKAVAGAEFTKLQNDLKGKLDAVIAQKRKEFDDFYAARKSAVEGQLASYTQLIDQQTGALDAKKKELTDRLENEKKGKLDDALKGIFKH